jgi:G:T-mismatch repair DNA endonuclease (very short patch repair protein)
MIRKKTYKQRKAKAIKNLAQYKNSDETQKETGIERRMRVLLDSMGLYYIQEKAFSWKGKTRIFDFYITTGTMSFCIECDGSYWHAEAYQEGDQKYSELTKIQKKNLRNDKFKNMMMHELGIPLLRFSETDIKRNISIVFASRRHYLLQLQNMIVDSLIFL